MDWYCSIMEGPLLARMSGPPVRAHGQGRVAEQRINEQGEGGKTKRGPYRRPKTGNREGRDERGDPPQHEPIHHKREQTQGHEVDGQSYDQEKGLHQQIQKSQHRGGPQHRQQGLQWAVRVQADAAHRPGHQSQTDGVDQPLGDPGGSPFAGRSEAVEGELQSVLLTDEKARKLSRPSGTSFPRPKSKREGSRDGSWEGSSAEPFEFFWRFLGRP